MKSESKTLDSNYKKAKVKIESNLKQDEFYLLNKASTKCVKND